MKELTPPRAVVTTSSYAVVGSTVSELRTVQQALGPTRGGRPFGAYTDWTVNWAFDIAGGTRLARVVNTRVCVRANIILPRWRPPRSASPWIIAEWQRYLHALEAHEQGHVKWAIEAGHGVLLRLEGLDGDLDVERLRSVALATAEEVVSGVREQESRYDETSGHGSLQGALLLDEPSLAG